MMSENKRTLIIKKSISKLGSTGFFHVFGTTAMNKIISFASGIILVRLISKSEYGVFSYANNLLNLFMIACGFGAASGILQMCSERREEQEKRQLYTYASRSSFLANCCLGACILFVAFFVPLKIEGANRCLGMMAFLPIFSYTYEMQVFYLRTQRRNKEYSYANTFSTLVIFLLSCCLSYFFSITGLVAAKYISFTLSALFILWRFRVEYPITKKAQVSPEIKKQFWSISMISMLNNGVSSLMYLLDIFVLGIVVPDSMIIASYRIATTIPTALAFIPAAVITYIYPYFAQKKEDKHWVLRRYFQITAVLGIGSAAIATFMFFFAPSIIRLVFGSAYVDCVPAFRILSLSFALSSTFRILPGNILVTQRKLKFNLFVAFLSSAINTALNVVMINAYGAVGAACATIITVAISSVLNVYYLIRVLKT